MLLSRMGPANRSPHQGTPWPVPWPWPPIRTRSRTRDITGAAYPCEPVRHRDPGRVQAAALTTA